MNENRTAIEAQGIAKSFGDVKAVDNVSFRVGKGEVLGLLGPNGAGKTTTVRIITGLLEPDAGQVVIDGSGDPKDPEARRRMGLAPQELAFYEGLTGYENVWLWGRLHGLRGDNLKDNVAWALDFVGLTERARDRASTYSGGMKRRLNLAMAIVNKPEVLVLDEPTVGVDPQSRAAILERLRELAEEGTAVLFTTHYMEEAQKLCDRVAIIDHGRILAEDTVRGLIARYGEKPVVVVERGDATLRIPTDDPAAEVGKWQRQGGVERIAVQMPNLEQVFLHLTGKELRD